MTLLPDRPVNNKLLCLLITLCLFCIPDLQDAKKATKQEEPPKKEEPKFQAFTGKKYSLKG